MSNASGQLGTWLRQEMLKRGYDPRRGGQSRLAREAGVAASSINRALNQGYGVENDVLRRLGKALGYSFGEMLVFAGEASREELPVRPPEELVPEEPLPSVPDDNPFTHPHERQIWEWEDLPEVVRKHVIVSLRAALELHADQP